MRIRKPLIVVALVVVGAVASAQVNTLVRGADTFILNSLPQRTFVERIEQGELWGLSGGGHGAGVVNFSDGPNGDHLQIAVLYHPASKGCWIGNVTEPHNWTPAPVEVCK